MRGIVVLAFWPLSPRSVTSGSAASSSGEFDVLEEKLFAALLTSTPDEEIVSVRAQADRDLAPYRRKMSGAQIDRAPPGVGVVPRS